MFNNPFLDGPAVNRNRRQQLDHLLRITAPHERIILAGIGLVVLALLLWALFGSIARSITVDGLLIAPGERHEVVSIEPGYLEKYLVRPGDHLDSDDPVARQSVPELDRETAVVAERVALLEESILRAGSGSAVLHAQLQAAEAALIQMKARRSARELIISHIGGQVMALQAVAGEYLPTGKTVALLRDVEHEPFRAVLRIDPHLAQRVAPGMQAEIEIATPAREGQPLHGEVTRVVSGPLPGWLAAMSPGVPESMHRIDVVLHGAEALEVADGTPCRVRIQLGRSPLTALFEPGAY